MRNQLSVLRWVAMAVLMVAACKEDPTSSLLNGFSRLELEFSYREVVIGDSVSTYVVERDDQGNPLPPTATIAVGSGCTAGVASVRTTSAAPQLRTAFYVRGLAYGTSCVVASAGGKTDTMQVATFPLGVRVTGPDTVVSASTGNYAYAYFDARQQTITVPVVPTWSTSSSGIATVTTAGVVSGFDPGVVTVRATGPGSGNITTAPTCTGCVRGTKVVFVDPRPFTGTVAGAISGGLPGDTVIFVVGGAARKFNQTDVDSINNGGGVTSAAVRPTFNFTFVETFLTRLTPDSAYVIIPPTAKAGAMDLVLSRRDSSRTSEKVTFTSPSTSGRDQYDPGDDPGPGAGLAITTSGEYFLSMDGRCVEDPSGIGVPGDPGADCDDWIEITNTGGTTAAVTINVLWLPAGADLDLYVFDAAFGFAGGSFVARPERVTVNIPAGETWYIWINNFDSHGIGRQLARVRITGLP